MTSYWHVPPWLLLFPRSKQGGATARGSYPQGALRTLGDPGIRLDRVHYDSFG